MGFLGAVLIVVFIATAALLIGVILLQDEQGEGLGGIFGGGSATPFGSRSGNVLTKFTTILGVVFLVCAFGIAWVNRSTQTGNVLAAAKKEAAQKTTAWWDATVNSNESISGGKNPASSTAPAAAAGAASSSSGQQPAKQNGSPSKSSGTGN